MPISKWNKFVYGLDIWNELEDVQWSRSSCGTQWRFSIRSCISKPFSGINKSVHPMIRDKTLPSLFQEKKKKVLTDSCCCYFLFPHKEKEPISVLSKWLRALGKFEHSYMNVLNNLPRNEKMPTSQQPRFLLPNLTLSWCNCCFWREAYETITSGHTTHQPGCGQLCAPAPDTRTLLPRHRIPP